MSHFVAIHLDLHCLSNNSFTCSNLKGVLRNKVCFSDAYESMNATDQYKRIEEIIIWRQN